MLVERYIAGQLQSLPEPIRPFLRTVQDIRRLAGLHRLVCTGTGVFEESRAMVTRYFALQDQTLQSRQNVLQIAGSLASRQHDRSFVALARTAREAGLPLREPEMEQEEPALLARLDRTWYLLGDEAAMEANEIELGVTSRTMAAQLESEGGRVLFLAQKQPKRLLAIFAIHDSLLPEAPSAVRRLRELGVETVLLTSEKNRIAGGVAASLGIDLVRSELSEEEKEQVLASLVTASPDSAVVCEPRTFLKTPQRSFVILIDTKSVPSASVVLPSLALLPDLLTAAQDLADQIRRRFFWIKL